MTKEQLLELLKAATTASNSAADDFECAGDHTHGDVPNGLINFHRAIGRARVALARAEIDMLKVRIELLRASDSTNACGVEPVATATSERTASPRARLCVGKTEAGTLLDESGYVVYRIKTVPSLDDLQVPLSERARLEAQLKADAALFAAAHELASALREIAEPLDCGCQPCTGACASADMRELHDVHREIAKKALASIPGGGA